MSGDILCKGNEVHQVCFISVNQITVISLFEMKFSFLVIIYFYCESFGNKFPVLIRGNVHMVIMHYTLISLFKMKRTSKGNYCKKKLKKKCLITSHTMGKFWFDFKTILGIYFLFTIIYNEREIQIKTKWKVFLIN